MSKQKPKRNKSYRPKYVAKNPISTFFGGLSGDHMSHLQGLFGRNHGAMARVAMGHGTRDDWDLLVGAINMGNVMCEMGIGNEFREAMIAGRDALCEMGKRAMKTERFVFTGDELAAMNEALACHDAQLENIRAIDVDRASDEVIKRIRHGINTTSIKRELEAVQ